MPHRKLITVACASACMATGASNAVAEERQQSALEEIVVTARFRDENVNDLGVSIKAMTGDQLGARGIDSVSDLSRLTASLSIQERGPNRNEISIRGVGRSLYQQDLTAAPPNIGIYFDDVPVNVIVGSQIDIRSLDLDRVEVVRGPQGTLYGEGAQGGAIRYFSRDPDLTDFGGKVEASANSIEDGGSDFGGNFTVNVPLVEGKAGLRLSAGRTAYDGFFDNTYDDAEDLDGYVANTFRSVLLIEPDERWRIRLSGHYEDFEQEAFNSTNPQDPDSREFGFAGTADNSVREESAILSSNIQYEFNKLTIESITSHYTRERQRHVLDHYFTNAELVGVHFLDEFGISQAVFGGPFPITDQGVDSVDEFEWSQFSQEFRFVSNLDGRFNFVAGAFYREFEFDLSAATMSTLFPTQLPLYLENLTALGIPFGTPPASPSSNKGILARQLGLVGIPQLNYAPERSTTGNDGEQVSVFGEVTLDVSDTIKLIGGLRWHKEDIDLDAEESAASILNSLSPVVPFPFSGEANIDVLLPKASLEWRPVDALLTYATYSEGVRNGNVNGGVGFFVSQPGVSREAAEAAASFDEETVRSYEIGLKNSFLDERLSLNLAAFYTEIDDVQGTAQIVDQASGYVVGATANVGDGHTQGFEVELQFAMNDFVRLFAGGNWTEAEIDEVFSNPVLDVSIQEGQRMPFIPDSTFAAGLDANHPLTTGWELFGNATFTYTGEYTTFVNGEEGSRTNPELGNFSVVDLSVGVRNEEWSVDLRVNNVFDKIELIQASPTTAFIEQAIGGFAFLPAGTPLDNYDDYQINRPRTFVLTARYQF